MQLLKKEKKEKKKKDSLTGLTGLTGLPLFPHPLLVASPKPPAAPPTAPGWSCSVNASDRFRRREITT